MVEHRTAHFATQRAITWRRRAYWLIFLLALAALYPMREATAAGTWLYGQPTEVSINETVTANLRTNDAWLNRTRECEIWVHNKPMPTDWTSQTTRLARGNSRDECGADTDIGSLQGEGRLDPSKFAPGQAYSLSAWAVIGDTHYREFYPLTVRPLGGSVDQSTVNVGYGTRDVLISGNVNSGATHMIVYRDGSEVARFANQGDTATTSGRVDVSGLTQGSWTLRVYAALVHSGGVHWQHLKDVTVTRQASPPPPKPTWVSPNDNVWHRHGSNNLDMTGNAVAGIEQLYVVQQRADGSQWNYHYIDNFTQGNDGNFTVPIYGSLLWSEGDYQVRFMVKRQGTWSAYSDWRTLKIDNTGPTVAWTGLSAKARTITVKGKVTDTLSGPSWVRVHYKRDTNTTWSDGGWSYVDASGNFSHSFIASAPASGTRTYDVRFFGVDKAGNESDWSETRKIAIKRSQPVVEWLAPAAQTAFVSTPTYRVRITDPETSIAGANITVRYTNKYGQPDVETDAMKKDGEAPDVWYFKASLADFHDIKDGSAFTAEVVATNADKDRSVKVERSFNKAAVEYFGEFTLTPPANLGGVKPGDTFDLSLRIKADGMPRGVRIDLPLPDGLEADGEPRYDAANSTSDAENSWKIPANIRAYWNGKSSRTALISAPWDSQPYMDHEEIVVIKLPVKVSEGATHGPRTATAAIWQHPGESNKKIASATIQIGTDNTPPELAWVSPAANSVHGDALPIAVSATDDKSGINEVKLDWRVDGGAWQTTPASMSRGTGDQYIHALDITGIAAGKTIEVRMKATDNARNQSEWTSIRAFRKGQYFETFALTLPAGSPDLRPGATFDLTLRVKADVAMRDVQFELPLPAGLMANGAPRIAAGTDETGNNLAVAQHLNTEWNGASRPLLTHPTRLPGMAAGNVVILSIPVRVSHEAQPGSVAVVAKGWRGGAAHQNERSSALTLTVVPRVGDVISHGALLRHKGQDVDQSGGFTPGDTLIYRLSLSAVRDAEIAGLRLEYAVPDGLQANGTPAFAPHSDVTSGLNPAWDGTTGNPQLLGAGVTLPAGKTLMIDIPVRLITPRDARSTVTSNVGVTASNASGYKILSDTFAWQNAGFEASAALQTGLTVLPANAQPRPGESLTYEATLRARRWALVDAQLTFDLPAGLARDPARALSFAPTSQVNTGLNQQWDGSGQLLAPGVALPADQTIVVRVPVQVRDQAVPGPLVSRVAAGATNVRGMQFAEHLLTLSGQPPETGQLSLVKHVDRETAQPGQTLTYTIHFRNLGVEPLNNIDIHDAAPAHTRLLGAACGSPMPAALKCSPKTGESGEHSVRWEFDGHLPAGASGRVSYTVQIRG
ncbi:DUF11 domain-containing protein [Pandoraea sp.]|uniref:DUF11 domain-containing protein n=1 Tax=Pandoraea sp. TaxID=1883445 RepID=UPI0025DD2DA4|nr:DUF11 domain-containing protein [Pandoraea sp.]